MLVFGFIFKMSRKVKIYFERKKRDPSKKSNDSNKRKKASDSSLGLSLSKDDTDIFAMGLD